MRLLPTPSMKLEVVGGDFQAHPKSRYHWGKLHLARAEKSELLLLSYRPDDLARFEVLDGTWGDYWSQIKDWTKVIYAGSKAGLPAAASNQMLRNFIPGQRFLLTLAGSVIGAVAAKNAVHSGNLVTIRATFKNGHVLRAKVRERELTRFLPQLVNHLVQAQNAD